MLPKMLKVNLTIAVSALPSAAAPPDYNYRPIAPY